MTETLLVALLSVLGGGGLGAAIIGYMKDRKKDEATAKLTDVEALQKQVVLLTTVTDFLRKENSQLQTEYESESDKNRKLRARMSELEEELQAVRRTASKTQEQCDELSAKLRELAKGGNGDSDRA